jgi:hypothetical protein
VPLSEHEQRILQEIEARLYESDPALAREVGSTTLFTHALRNIKRASLGFVAGMAVMLVALSTHWAIAFAGFVIMLLCALTVERNARKMGRAGWQQITGAGRPEGVRNIFGATGQKMRERFQRNVEE